MTGRATGAGPCHPHHAAERRLIGRHNGRFHLGLSDLQAVANHFLGAEAFLLHDLTTGVASVRLNLSSRAHAIGQLGSVNRKVRENWSRI